MIDRLSTVQLQVSQQLRQRVISELRNNNGWIGFDCFMQRVLYDPEFGYYSTGAKKLGEAGDFITSPILGSQFAHCVARQCMEVLNNLNSDTSVIIEYGAGNGRLALDILQYLEQKNQLPDRYCIVEVSGQLKKVQRNTIKQYAPHLLNYVKWVDQPDKDCTAVIIANELLDAFPVKRFEMAKGEAYELGIVYRQHGFAWQRSEQPMSAALQNKLATLDIVDGYQSEINSQLQPWIDTVSARLKAGVILIIDYGFPQHEYYHPDRNQGTLICHYLHQSHTDPFVYLGLQDITAHVNFSALANSAEAVELRILGYCNQAQFLLSMGLLDTVVDSHSRASVLHNQEIKKLTLPHEMGELFKVIALSRNYDRPLAGFNMKNSMGRL